MKIKPSAMVLSGRGCQLIYKIENVSYKLGWMVEKTTKGIIKKLKKIIKENNIDLSVDEGASKYHGYFRAVGSTNPKTVTTVTFTDYHRNYTYNCCCQLYQLTTKRLNLTYQRLNQLQDSGQDEGYRDKILFLAYACYYAQNKDTARFEDTYSLDAQPILMGVGLLKYLCLPMGVYIPKYEKFKPLKKLIKKRLGCDALKNVDFRYSYAQDKLLTASLRKLLYLGFIKGFKGSANGLSRFILSSLDLSKAEDKAKVWFYKSLMLKHICSDSYLSQYLSQSDLDKIMFVKGYNRSIGYLAILEALQGIEMPLKAILLLKLRVIL